jgi:hypothetical protein
MPEKVGNRAALQDKETHSTAFSALLTVHSVAATVSNGAYLV